MMLRKNKNLPVSPKHRTFYSRKNILVMNTKMLRNGLMFISIWFLGMLGARCLPQWEDMVKHGNIGFFATGAAAIMLIVIYTVGVSKDSGAKK